MTHPLKIKFIFKALLAVTFLLCADPALAVQHHGGAEGLVAHKLGHLLLSAGIIFLLYGTYQAKHTESGWSEFRGFLWLMIAWNILTFSGHWLYELRSHSSLHIIDNIPSSFSVNNLSDALFYLTRLDHFLLVPALFLLLKALQKWRRAT